MNDDPKQPAAIPQFHQARVVAASRDKINLLRRSNVELSDKLHVHESYLRIMNRLVSRSFGSEGDDDHLEKELYELEAKLRIEGCREADRRAKDQNSGSGEFGPEDAAREGI
jgi:hypothetical protein